MYNKTKLIRIKAEEIRIDNRTFFLFAEEQMLSKLDNVPKEISAYITRKITMNIN
jgi:hypothetical protein